MGKPESTDQNVRNSFDRPMSGQAWLIANGWKWNESSTPGWKQRVVVAEFMEADWMEVTGGASMQHLL